MRKSICSLGLLEERLSGVGRTIALLDTSAVIDIQKMLYDENLVSHEAKTFDQYMRQIQSGKIMVVTPGVLDEIRRHAGVRLNGHQREVSAEALGTGMIYHDNFTEEFQNINIEDAGEVALRNYLAVSHIEKQLCGECKDEPSRVDLELLRRAADFSTIPNYKGELPSAVAILTSDKHVISGTQGLNSLGYQIKVVSTK